MNLINVILQCKAPDILNVGMSRVYYDRTFLIDSRNIKKDTEDIDFGYRDWIFLTVYKINESDIYSRFCIKG